MASRPIVVTRQTGGVRARWNAEIFLWCLGLLVCSQVQVACREGTRATEQEDAIGSTTKGAALASKDKLPKDKPNESPLRIVYPAAPGSFVKLVRQIAPSIVTLRAASIVVGGPADLIPGAGNSKALGSAFVLSREGYLVTSAHVIDTAPEIFARLGSGDEYRAQVVGRDTKLDLALLKIKAPPADLYPAKLGDSKTVQVGEWILALGNPEGGEVTASAGIVSALGALSSHSMVAMRTNYQGFMRTDARIDSGNSGGPVVNTTGEVIGISSASEAKGGDMRFIVPINSAKRIFPMLKEDGVVTRAWLGVFVNPLTPKIATEKGMENVSGALVSEVVAGSPAALAGIMAGDVIVAFDGTPVDHRSLPALAQATGIGLQIPITVWRNGERRKILLQSAKMPE